MREKAGSETVMVSIRMDKELKQRAEVLFAEFGMNMSTAINVFARQSVREGKIPFEISLGIPNATTLAAMQEVEDMIRGKIPKYSMSVDDFLKEQ
jgi:DNA-damage-inducible protein J